MTKLNRHLRASCPIARTSAIIGDHWNVLIIRDLLKGPKHFSELTESLTTMSTRTLTLKLQFLVAHDIVARSSEKRPQYTLSKKGLALRPVIAELSTFGEKYMLL